MTFTYPDLVRFLEGLDPVIENTEPIFPTGRENATPRNFVVGGFDPDVRISSQARMQPKDFFPKVKRIVYNDPATKVWFEDGTSVLVKTSSTDRFSKELGLVYALIKRLFGTPDEKGNVSSDGYMCELKRLSESAYDQKAAESRKKSPEEGAKKNPSGGAKKNPKGQKKSCRK